MHWKKNRKVHPESKEQIIQSGQCPGCGRAVQFYYGEAGQFCSDCRKAAETARNEERAERVNERKAEKKRHQSIKATVDNVSAGAPPDRNVGRRRRNMAMFPIGEDDDAAGRMAEMFGPAQIDQQVRQAIQFCWMGLPKERRSVEEVETQVRRIVDRALRDFREDRQAFGKAGDA